MQVDLDDDRPVMIMGHEIARLTGRRQQLSLTHQARVPSL
jgi:hypothetical protein